MKGSVEPFQVLHQLHALIIPGENYIGINVKKNFKSEVVVSPQPGLVEMVLNWHSSWAQKVFGLICYPQTLLVLSSGGN